MTADFKFQWINLKRGLNAVCILNSSLTVMLTSGWFQKASEVLVWSGN